MASKQELAALMAADGEFDKKISLLKKAVVTVTKQKQEVEKQQLQLQEELQSATQRLTAAQRENGVLQRRVATLEGELEQERKGSSRFGQGVFKGLSSIMGNQEGGGGGTTRGGGKSSNGLSLSSEDVERVVQENEQLHMQLYSLKTQCEETERSAKAATKEGAKSATKAQRELEELRSLLDTTTNACDALNSDCARYRSAADFCRYFFRLSLHSVENIDSAGLPPSPHLVWPAGADGGVRLPSAARSAAAEAFRLSITTVNNCFRAVRVLANTLLEKLPRLERSTVGDIQCIRAKLLAFSECNDVEQQRMVYLMEQLEAFVATFSRGEPEASSMGEYNRDSGERAGATLEQIVAIEEEALRILLKWLAVVRLHAPLFVTCCVSFLPQGHAFTLRRVAAPELQSIGEPEQVERDAFIAAFAKEVTACLSCVEASVQMMMDLLKASPKAMRQGADPAQSPAELTDRHVDTLLALQHFWWCGTASLPLLHQSATLLCAQLTEVASTCNKSEIRDSLNYLLNTLKSICPQIESSCTAGVSRVPHLVQQRDHAALLASSAPPVVMRADQDELLAALAAADRAAACYYTELNLLYVEMGEKEDILRESEKRAEKLERQLRTEKREAEDTRKALQEKVSQLSSQLIAYASK